MIYYSPLNKYWPDGWVVKTTGYQDAQTENWGSRPGQLQTYFLSLLSKKHQKDNALNNNGNKVRWLNNNKN